MKIGIRLAIGFGIALLITAAITIVAYTNVETLQTNIEFTYKDRIPKVRQANEIINNINIATRNTRDIILHTDKQKMAEDKKDIDNAGGRNY